jgi:peptidylprolyl isomerase
VTVPGHDRSTTSGTTSRGRHVARRRGATVRQSPDRPPASGPTTGSPRATARPRITQAARRRSTTDRTPGTGPESPAARASPPSGDGRQPRAGPARDRRQAAAGTRPEDRAAARTDSAGVARWRPSRTPVGPAAAAGAADPRSGAGHERRLPRRARPGGSRPSTVVGMAPHTRPTVTIPDDPPPADLMIEDLEIGDGTEAVPGLPVAVHYVGVSWSNGKEFDSSWSRNELFSFTLGAGHVISGWDRGVAGMKVGGAAPLDHSARPRVRRAGSGRSHRPERDAGVRGRPVRGGLTRTCHRGRGGCPTMPRRWTPASTDCRPSSSTPPERGPGAGTAPPPPDRLRRHPTSSVLGRTEATSRGDDPPAVGSGAYRIRPSDQGE